MSEWKKITDHKPDVDRFSVGYWSGRNWIVKSACIKDKFDSETYWRPNGELPPQPQPSVFEMVSRNFCDMYMIGCRLKGHEKDGYVFSAHISDRRCARLIYDEMTQRGFICEVMGRENGEPFMDPESL